ncbi:uncharacterized protein JCM15063_000376 [Sporobolomyces koalae]|uniref:uncharacterized protein n=1 Tax=Sporobolomyces koalae TaxID=500713 RepID=UPI003175C513
MTTSPPLATPSPGADTASLSSFLEALSAASSLPTSSKRLFASEQPHVDETDLNSAQTRGTGATGTTETEGHATRSIVESVDRRDRQEGSASEAGRTSWVNLEEEVSSDSSLADAVQESLRFPEVHEPQITAPQHSHGIMVKREESEEEEPICIKLEDPDGDYPQNTSLLRVTSSQEAEGLDRSVTRSQSDFTKWLEDTMRFARGDGTSVLETDDALSSIIEATRQTRFGHSTSSTQDFAEGPIELEDPLPSERELSFEVNDAPPSETRSDQDIDENIPANNDEVKMSEPSAPIAKPSRNYAWKLLSLSLSVALAYSLHRQRDLSRSLRPTPSTRFVPAPHDNSTRVYSPFATPLPVADTFALPIYALFITVLTAVPMSMHLLLRGTPSKERESADDKSRAQSPLIEMNGDGILAARECLSSGIEHYNAHRLDAATAAFASILDLACAPDDKARAAEWLGRTHYRAARQAGDDLALFDKAAKAFERSIRADRTRAEPRARLGKTKYRMRDDQGAVKALKMALKRDETLAWAHEWLAKALYRIKETPIRIVKKHLERAIELDSESYRAEAFLGEILHLSGKNASALLHLERSNSLRFDQPQVHARIAYIASEQVKVQLAKRHLRMVLKTRDRGRQDDSCPDSLEAVTGISPYFSLYFTLSMSDKEERIQVLDQARAEYPHDDLAQVLYAIERSPIDRSALVTRSEQLARRADRFEDDLYARGLYILSLLGLGPLDHLAIAILPQYLKRTEEGLEGLTQGAGTAMERRKQAFLWMALYEAAARQKTMIEEMKEVEVDKQDKHGVTRKGVKEDGEGGLDRFWMTVALFVYPYNAKFQCSNFDVAREESPSASARSRKPIPTLFTADSLPSQWRSLGGMDRDLGAIRRPSYSSRSSSPSTTLTHKTPPYTPSKALHASPSPCSRHSPRPPLTPTDSPTSFLTSALGGLTLRDLNLDNGTSSPDRTRYQRGSLNKSGGAHPTPGALGLANMASQQTETHQTLKSATSFELGRVSFSLHELAILAVSSGITELSMTIQEVSTLIFEIQELRHTSSASRASNSTSATESASLNAVSEMDKALMNLDARLEQVGKEFADIETQIGPILDAAPAGSDSGEVYFLREKWNSTLDEWNSVQADADMLGEEMKEDKWLVVFNSVIKQAEDMMNSLEKILTQSHQFAWDVSRRTGRSSSSATSDSGPIVASASTSSVSSLSHSPKNNIPPRDIQALLSSFIALHRSLHAKVKYYSPACDRVLKILGKGIADRSTKNGEVLRRFAEMKSRWKELQERVVRVEAEMKGVEDTLREAAGPDEDQDREKDRSRQADLGNTLTPPREPPVGRISPLRRLANKISPSTTPTRPDRFFRQSSLGASIPSSSAMLASSSSSSTSPSTSRARRDTTPTQTPPRPPKSDKRIASPASPAPQTPYSRPPLSQRRSASALAASVGSPTAGATGRPIPRRAISPMPTPSLADRPRWNPSTKRTDDDREVLMQSALGNGRPSVAGTPRNGRNSSMGLRASSRLSMNSSLSRSYNGARPVSPAFSDASSAIRERPMTPSRIPRPSSVIRPRSTTPYSHYDGPDNTSIMQRMASSPSTTNSAMTANRSRPPVAPSRYSMSRSTGPPRSSSASLLPTVGGLSPPRAVSPAPSATSSSSRIAHREPGLRPRPVSRLSSTTNPKLGGQTTPRASMARPVSSLAYDRAGALSPLPNGDSTATAYCPNPLDPLDLAVADIVNSLPLALYVERVEPALTRAQAAQVELFSARYVFSLSPLQDQRKAVLLKLVDRVGPRAKKGERKVLARVGGGWQDLESHCFSLIARAG